MPKLIITWEDLEGRYWTASPAYAANPNLTPEELIDQCINHPVKGHRVRLGLPADHPFFLVEDADQRARLAECCAEYFRWGGAMRPDRAGRLDSEGNIILTRDALDGAWEMDTDGRPKVNMARARNVQMDKIRLVRNAELVKEDINMLKAIEAGDASAQSTVATKKQVLRDLPATFDITTGAGTSELLKAKWPTELPDRE